MEPVRELAHHRWVVKVLRRAHLRRGPRSGESEGTGSGRGGPRDAGSTKVESRWNEAICHKDVNSTDLNYTDFVTSLLLQLSVARCELPSDRDLGVATAYFLQGPRVGVVKAPAVREWSSLLGESVCGGAVLWSAVDIGEPVLVSFHLPPRSVSVGLDTRSWGAGMLITPSRVCLQDRPSPRYTYTPRHLHLLPVIPSFSQPSSASWSFNLQPCSSPLPRVQHSWHV